METKRVKCDLLQEYFEQVALNEKKKKKKKKKEEEEEKKVFPYEFREVSKEFQNMLEALMF